jgi:superfamily II DNA or RNA helicase
MKTTSITNFGYLINKNEWSEDYLTIIKKDLTVKPFIDNKYCLLEEEPFPVFQEGTSRLLIPKYYGIEKMGMPQIINIDISNIQKANLKFNGTLRDYQVPIINTCMKHYMDESNKLLPFGGGILTVPPGKGKTCMGLYIGCQIGYPILIIVHKTFLVNQWLERIKEYVPNAKIGTIQQNVIDIEGKDIVIGMLQSICLKEYDEDVFERFPLVIFDEVHHLGAKVFSKALQKIQAPYTLGLTATPERKDKLEKVFYWYLGKSMYYEGADVDKSVNIKLYKYGLSSPNKMFKEVFNFRIKQMNIAKMVTNLTELSCRTEFILKLIDDIFNEVPYDLNSKDDLYVLDQKYIKQNMLKDIPLFNDLYLLDPEYKCRKVLVLSNRVNHLKLIDELLQKKNKRWKNSIGYYIGGMKEKKLKESELKPLILATFEMASEGLDIKNLDTLILATPKSNITQSIGRILRIQADKRTYIPTVYDIVDNISVFMNQGKKRYSDYVSKEYNVEWFNVIDTIITKTDDKFLYASSTNKKNDVIDDQFIDD